MQRVQLNTYFIERQSEMNKVQTILTRIVGDGPYILGNIEIKALENMTLTPVFSAFYDINHTIERGVLQLKKNNDDYNSFLGFTNSVLKTVKTPKMQSLVESQMITAEKKFLTVKLYCPVKFFSHIFFFCQVIRVAGIILALKVLWVCLIIIFATFKTHFEYLTS